MKHVYILGCIWCSFVKCNMCVGWLCCATCILLHVVPCSAYAIMCDLRIMLYSMINIKSIKSYLYDNINTYVKYEIMIYIFHQLRCRLPDTSGKRRHLQAARRPLHMDMHGGETRHVTSVCSRVRCGTICLGSLDCVMFTYGSDLCVLFVGGGSTAADITSQIYSNMTWFIIK